MIKRRGTAGGPVDTLIDKLISDINISVGSQSSKTNNGAGYIDPVTGAHIIRAYNNSGGRLVQGGLVTPSLTPSLTIGITYAGFSERNISGVVFKEVAPNSIGEIVIKGPCQVYFNPNGSTFGESFRMSFATDHISANVGMAESESFNRIAGPFKVGSVFETRVGEGLAWCLI